MFLKSKINRVLVVSGLILSLFAVSFADTIHLKDGSSVKGKVIGFKDGQFVVLIGEGKRQREMRFFADEVEKIEFEAPALPSAPAQANTPPANQQPSSGTAASTIRQPENPVKPSVKLGPPNSGNVIIVGANKNPQPATGDTSPATKSQPATIKAPVSSGGDSMGGSSIKPKPISVNVKVLADNTANGWTNSGWVVRKGQRIKINGSGRISLGGGRFSTPEGVGSVSDSAKLKKDEATGGLIAVIGDDNNDFIFIGNGREFIAARDGVLFLGINEGNLDDNSGAFDVSIEIDPNIK